MKTLREKIKKALDNTCYSINDDSFDKGHALGEVDAFKKALQWLDEEEKSFEEQANGMNDEANSSTKDSYVTFDFCSGPWELISDKENDKPMGIPVGYVPYQLCPKCNGHENIFRTCHICNGEGIIPMHKA